MAANGGGRSATGSGRHVLFRWSRATLATMLAVAGLLVGQVAASPASAQDEQRPGTTIEDVLAEPNRYFGRQVTISGEVSDVLGPRSFTLIDDDLGFGYVGTQIPVIAQSGAGPGGTRIDARTLVGQQARVTGTVRRFDHSAVENELGVDLDDAAWAPFAGRPAIIATRVAPQSTPSTAQGAAGSQTGQSDQRAPRGQQSGQPDQQAHQGQQPGQTPPQQPAGRPTVVDIVNNPSRYYGQRVVVTSNLGVVLGPRSFSLTSDDLLPGQGVPVVASRSLDLVGLSTWPVRVVGTVHQFNLRAFEDRLGVDLNDNAWAAFAGQPAIIATRVTPLVPPGQGAGDSPERPSARAGSGDGAASGHPVNANVNMILDNPGEYYRQEVTITGEAARRLGPRSFTLAGGTQRAREIPVVAPASTTGGQALDLDWLLGRRAWVVGTVHQFNLRAFEDQFDVDLDDNAWAPFAGQPVLVAGRVDLALTPSRATGSGQESEPEMQPGQAGQPGQRPGAPQAGGPAAGPQQTGATIGDILNNPSQYYDRQVTITGVVSNIPARRAFTLSDDLTAPMGTDIPVVAPASADLRGVRNLVHELVGQQVQVTGTVRRFDQSTVGDMFRVDIADSPWAGRVGGPVIVASRVTPRQSGEQTARPRG